MVINPRISGVPYLQRTGQGQKSKRTTPMFVRRKDAARPCSTSDLHRCLWGGARKAAIVPRCSKPMLLADYHHFQGLYYIDLYIVITQQIRNDHTPLWAKYGNPF